MSVVNIKGAAFDPDAVLEQAKGEFGSVVLIGWDKDGILDVRASTNLERKDILWLIEAFKARLLSGDYEEDSE